VTGACARGSTALGVSGTLLQRRVLWVRGSKGTGCLSLAPMTGLRELWWVVGWGVGVFGRGRRAPKLIGKRGIQVSTAACFEHLPMLHRLKVDVGWPRTGPAPPEASGNSGKRRFFANVGLHVFRASGRRRKTAVRCAKRERARVSSFQTRLATSPRNRRKQAWHDPKYGGQPASRSVAGTGTGPRFDSGLSCWCRSCRPRRARSGGR